MARHDAATGEPVKRRYGPWMLTAMRLLARMKWLRATPFDPLGYSAERRMERALAVDYERVVARLCDEMTAADLDLACEIAAIPDAIRGYGPVKQRNADAARKRQDVLLAEWTRRHAPSAAQHDESGALLAH